MENQYLDINKASWNERAALHFHTDFYDNESFISGRNTLPEIDLKLLGDIQGQSVLHLQCHFGQDTISLSRLGAHVTGIDLSDKAIELGRELAAKCQTDTKFICSDVYGLKDVLNEQFDLTYSSYGTIGWLPDIKRWANTVSRFTKPNGRFVFVEFHPVLWMYDDILEDVAYSYFNSDPIIEEIKGTYAERKSERTFKTVSWNHGLAEVIQALVDEGFRLDNFKEYPYSPYDIFNDMKEISSGHFVTRQFGDKVPYIYSLVCTKL